MQIDSNQFGPDFVWGCASAAFQIEGAVDEDGKGPSIWDDFTSRKGKIKTGETARVACDHYHRYEEDLDLLAAMAFKNYRFSVAWTRILPEGKGQINQKGLDFYDRLVDACLERSITPWLTCYHWDLPLALHHRGGWPERSIVGWFEEYVDSITSHLGDRVKNWIVLNEPVAFVGKGYGDGEFAPGEKSVKKFLKATHHVALAQSAGGRIIRENVPDAQIGTTFSCSTITPNTQSKLDLQAARTFDALYNRLFIEPAVGLGYPVDDLRPLRAIEKYMKAGDDELLPFDFDFIGIQNYYRVVAKWTLWPPLLFAKEVPARKREVEVNTMGFEVFPEGMYDMLRKFASYQGVKKIIVTENGTCTPDVVRDGRVEDPLRIQFFERYLDQVLRAKQEGIPVEGYFVWSLTDNFEWSDGYDPRFGLVHVDYSTQKRTVKESGYWWEKFLNSPV
jgi:beta-glucosidase